jgi:hypothetical protein
VLAALGIGFFALVSAAAHVLLARHYQSDVSDLALSSTTFVKEGRLKREPAILRAFSRMMGSHEARAVLMLFRAQFRYDAKFRMGLFASVPITLLYLVIAMFDGGIQDPFVGDLRSTLNAAMLYLVALLMPLLQLQSVSQSDNFKASWLFFSSPLDRAKLLLAVRNTLLAWIIVPYMLIMAVIFAFFMPPVRAIMHVLVLASIAGFVFQVFLMISPKMPFSQRRRPNRSSVAMIMGIFFFSFLALGILAVEIHWGYRTTTRYWTSIAILLTISLLLEQLVRVRLRAKLEKEEYEG